MPSHLFEHPASTKACKKRPRDVGVAGKVVQMFMVCKVGFNTVRTIASRSFPVNGFSRYVYPFLNPRPVRPASILRDLGYPETKMIGASGCLRFMHSASSWPFIRGMATSVIIKSKQHAADLQTVKASSPPSARKVSYPLSRSIVPIYRSIDGSSSTIRMVMAQRSCMRHAQRVPSKLPRGAFSGCWKYPRGNSL